MEQSIFQTCVWRGKWTVNWCLIWVMQLHREGQNKMLCQGGEWGGVLWLATSIAEHVDTKWQRITIFIGDPLHNVMVPSKVEPECQGAQQSPDRLHVYEYAARYWYSPVERTGRFCTLMPKLLRGSSPSITMEQGWEGGACVAEDWTERAWDPSLELLFESLLPNGQMWDKREMFRGSSANITSVCISGQWNSLHNPTVKQCILNSFTTG